tara:strand:- start:1383 stop:1898 length:516 start_codon:yes stop_codon:yes gene_type:complete
MVTGFDKNECTSIIEYADTFGKKHITQFSNDLSPEILDYNYTFIERNTQTQWMFNKFSNYLLPQFPNNKIKNHDVINLHEFPTGGKFNKHIDVHREADYYIIIGCVLNSNYTGGKLTAYNPDKDDLCEEQGHFYEMYSIRPHEVTLITSGTRYSLVLFLTRENLGIPQTII